MKRSQDILVAVARIGELAAAPLDTSEILGRIVTITAGIMKADVCSIYLIDHTDGALVLSATKGLSEDAVGAVRLHPGEGITGRSAKQERIIAVRDVTQDPRNKSFAITGEEPFRSLLSVPLRYHDELIGVMNVRTRKPRTFGSHERRLLKTIAHQVSGAIRNARLFEDVLAANRELELAHGKLVESEKMAALGRLAATLSHEVRNPLAGLKGASQLLLRKTSEGDERREYVNLILAEIGRLGRIVDDLLQFARPRVLRHEPIDLNHLLEDVLLLHSEDFANRGIIVRKRLSTLPAIMVDRDKLTQVVVNILLNARDAMPGGGQILITSGWVTTGAGRANAAVFQFRDTGSGIPEDVLSHVFEPFFTTRSTGVGLGLPTCKAIIEEHGGSISIHSSPSGEGVYRTLVTVELPFGEQSPWFSGK
jgi:two-component system, NtrC family, sensor histidine kinase HydH